MFEACKRVKVHYRIFKWYEEEKCNKQTDSKFVINLSEKSSEPENMQIKPKYKKKTFSTNLTTAIYT